MAKMKDQITRKHRGFKTKFSANDLKIITPIKLTLPYQEGEEISYIDGTWRGLWDTGATSSTICRSLAAKLNLPELSDCQLQGVGGVYDSKEYMAGLILPNSVMIPATSLYGIEDASDFDMLIGMDIITLGELLISVEGEDMFFSFQIPSFGGMYLDDIHAADLQNGRQFQRSHTFYRTTPKIGRNATCPCGSGKKYKNCCGMGK